jgi:uncharacterized protein
MQYRVLGKTGERVSVLGFGAMRLPTRGADADVDEPAAVEMIRHAIDRGVNYVDTAYVYHGGRGEGVVGRALGDGCRQRVLLATKSPIWSVEEPSDFDRFLDEQLDRLQTGCIDFYLLHSLQKRSWAKMPELRAFDFADRARADGRIRHFGFSFHDDFDAFREIIDAYNWSFCQIQYNLVNEEVQAGRRGLQYAAERGLGVIVMEPLFGGTLAQPPPAVRPLWDQSGRKPADVALRWLWDQPEVSLVLSGMSTLEQVKENLASAERAAVGGLSEEERDLVGRVQEAYKQLSPIPCTKCGYCLPCPQGVNIPLNFEWFNQATVYRGASVTLCRNLYHTLPDAERAAACEQCGACEERCPQGIEIGALMRRVADEFA